MRAADQVQVVLLQELGHAVGAKSIADTAVVLTPALRSKWARQTNGRFIGRQAGGSVGSARHACSELPSDLPPTCRRPPSHLHILVGVGPQQVAQQPGVWDIGRARDALDLLQRLELRGEAAVHAQDLHRRRAKERSVGLRQPKPTPDPLPLDAKACALCGCNS